MGGPLAALEVQEAAGRGLSANIGPWEGRDVLAGELVEAIGDGLEAEVHLELADRELVRLLNKFNMPKMWKGS